MKKIKIEYNKKTWRRKRYLENCTYYLKDYPKSRVYIPPLYINLNEYCISKIEFSSEKYYIIVFRNKIRCPYRVIKYIELYVNNYKIF